MEINSIAKTRDEENNYVYTYNFSHRGQDGRYIATIDSRYHEALRSEEDDEPVDNAKALKTIQELCDNYDRENPEL
jgi:hypothetical protein